MKAKKSKKRVIGRWYIGETLGKGGYSWVKKGKDIKTGKTVALKFMEKADSSWIKEQAMQVETEIDALKNIRHKNVMKLYAYNLTLIENSSKEYLNTTTIQVLYINCHFLYPNQPIFTPSYNYFQSNTEIDEFSKSTNYTVHDGI